MPTEPVRSRKGNDTTLVRQLASDITRREIPNKALSHQSASQYLPRSVCLLYSATDAVSSKHLYFTRAFGGSLVEAFKALPSIQERLASTLYLPRRASTLSSATESSSKRLSPPQRHGSSKVSLPEALVLSFTAPQKQYLRPTTLVRHPASDTASNLSSFGKPVRLPRTQYPIDLATVSLKR